MAFCLVDQDQVDQLSTKSWRISRDKYDKCYVLRSNGISMHRELLGLSTGDLRQGDHINGCGLDNRMSNLRIVTLLQNRQNRQKRAPATSRYRGVSYVPKLKKWRVRVQTNYTRIIVGFYTTEEAANEAAITARGKLYA